MELRPKREKAGGYLSCWLHKLLKKSIPWKARGCLWEENFTSCVLVDTMSENGQDKLIITIQPAHNMVYKNQNTL